MGNKIKIINLHKKYRLNVALLEKIVKKVLRHIKKTGAVELEIVFLDDRSIRRLNKEFKKEDRPTDVLSFDLGRGGAGHGILIGNIFVSLDRAIVNSKRFGTCPEEELVLCAIHGILHLFGYDDGIFKDRRRMEGKQKEILGGLCRNLSGVLTRR